MAIHGHQAEHLQQGLRGVEPQGTGVGRITRVHDSLRDKHRSRELSLRTILNALH
jgi:hypothetical protein